MDQISAQISALSDKIDRAIISEMMERYDRYRLNLNSEKVSLFILSNMPTHWR